MRVRIKVMALIMRVRAIVTRFTMGMMTEFDRGRMIYHYCSRWEEDVEKKNTAPKIENTFLCLPTRLSITSSGFSHALAVS
jgi:hypothetical protein